MYRAALLLHGEVVPLNILEDVEVTVVTEDSHGVETTVTDHAFELQPAPHTAVHFVRTPADCCAVSVAISASVLHLRTGDNGEKKKQHLTAKKRFTMDTTWGSGAIHDVFLTALPGGHLALQALGRLGEARPRLQIDLSLALWAQSKLVKLRVATDAQGICTLGPLDGVVHISACAILLLCFVPTCSWLRLPLLLERATTAFRSYFDGSGTVTQQWRLPSPEACGVQSEYYIEAGEGNWLTLPIPAEHGASHFLVGLKRCQPPAYTKIPPELWLLLPEVHGGRSVFVSMLSAGCRHTAQIVVSLFVRAPSCVTCSPAASGRCPPPGPLGWPIQAGREPCPQSCLHRQCACSSSGFQSR